MDDGPLDVVAQNGFAWATALVRAKMERRRLSLSIVFIVERKMWHKY